MKKFYLLIFVFISQLLTSQIAYANSIGFELKEGKTLSIATNGSSDGMWLGVTLYAQLGDQKPQKDELYPLTKGTKTTDITVPPEYKNGTFVAALWSKKVGKEQCSPQDALCQKAGYKLLDMRAYVWGYLPPK